jgi:LacI family transcriptional regulator
MVSIKDVAKLADVSVSTVSRVINNKDLVSEITKNRVLEAIKKLDYKPNLLAKGLRVKSGNIIGLLVPEIIIHAFIYIINYALEAVVKEGFVLILGCTHDNPDIEEKFIEDLIRRNVNGIIFSRVSDESRILRIINRTSVPIVVIDRTFKNEKVPHVVLDNYKAGVLAAEHFLELGHRNIACVTGPLNIGLCRERLNGFKDTLKKEGIELKKEMIYEGDFKFSSGIEAARYFLNIGGKITAIWAQNDLMALGTQRELLKNNIRIPEDLSIMGMDNVGIVEMVKPALSTISQPFREMCERAVDLIICQRNKKEIKDRLIVLEPVLVVRESTSYVR